MARLMYEVRKVPITINVSVRVTRELRIRTWLATALIRLAARIIGGRANVDVQST